MRHRHRRKTWDNLMPYLIIVCVGVIVILLVQFYSILTAKNELREVYFHIDKGEAKIHAFGSDDWLKAYSGTRFLQGDALRTSKDGRVVLEFFEGTKMRLGADTEISFDEMKSDDGLNKFIISLRRGDLWVNKAQNNEQVTDVEVNLDNTRVTSLGTVFALNNSSNSESVWVVKGQISLDVFKFEDEEKKVVDTIDVGVGQQALLGVKEFDAFRSYQRPYVLEAISDSFKAREWYIWNISQDKSPTDFSNSFSKNTQSDDFSDIDGPKTPKIVEPASLNKTSGEDAFVISGISFEDTEKIVVTHRAFGAVDTHMLSQFRPGDTRFTYRVGVDLGNLEPGKNTYTIVAFDELGNKSEEVVVTINYSPGILEELPAT